MEPMEGGDEKAVVRRRLMQQPSMAFDKWQRGAATMKAAKLAMGDAIRRMLQRQLSMAWEKWQFTATEMKQQEIHLRRGIMRMLMLPVAAGFYYSRL